MMLISSSKDAGHHDDFNQHVRNPCSTLETNAKGSSAMTNSDSGNIFLSFVAAVRGFVSGSRIRLGIALQRLYLALSRADVVDKWRLEEN
jgi:hypothetical protein